MNQLKLIYRTPLKRLSPHLLIVGGHSTVESRRVIEFFNLVSERLLLFRFRRAEGLECLDGGSEEIVVGAAITFDGGGGKRVEEVEILKIISQHSQIGRASCRERV